MTQNPPVYVYDSSGPYTDPDARIELKEGLAPIRASWISARGDTEELPGITSEYGRLRESDPRLAGLRFSHRRKPRVAKAGHNVTQLHYARKGIITPEMEFVAIRENLAGGGTASAQHPGADLRAPPSPGSSPRSSCATRWPAAAPSSRPTSTTRSASR